MADEASATTINPELLDATGISSVMHNTVRKKRKITPWTELVNDLEESGSVVESSAEEAGGEDRREDSPFEFAQRDRPQEKTSGKSVKRGMPDVISLVSSDEESTKLSLEERRL